MKLVVQECPPWDGEYECDIFSFSNEELHRIKKVSEGIRPAELVDALDNNDTAAFVGVAVVVLAQHDLTVDPDDFWKAKGGSLSLRLEARTDPPTATVGGSEPTEKNGSSGAGSSDAGDPEENDPRPTGNPGSETPSTAPGSVLLTSAP